MKKNLKLFILIIIIVVLIIGGVFLIKKRKKAVASYKKPFKPSYNFVTNKVKRETIEKSKRVLAQILPDKRVIISSKIIGYIKKVNFNAGDKIKKGDIIAEIDNANLTFTINNLKNQLESLVFQLKALSSEFDYIKEKFNRDKVLFQSGAISKENYQKSKSNFQNIKNNISSIKKKISSLKNELESKKHDIIYTKIIANFDAIVSKEFLKEGSLVGIGTPIIELISNKNFKILFQLPSNEVKEINETSFIEVNINNKIQKLKIQKIYPESSDNSLVVLESRIKELPPNISANSYIPIKLVFYEKSGLIIPLNSVLSLVNGDYLIKKTFDSLQKIKINIVFCNEKKCLIKSKQLKEGDYIVTGSENKLRLLIF